MSFNIEWAMAIDDTLVNLFQLHLNSRLCVDEISFSVTPHSRPCKVNGVFEFWKLQTHANYASLVSYQLADGMFLMMSQQVFFFS